MKKWFSWRNIIMARIVLSITLFSYAATLSAQTTTAPPVQDAAYWNMNRALSGVTGKALQSRGYVPNDPRTYSTLQGMSGAAKAAITGAGAAAGGALAVTLAGATAPAWASLVLFAGISSIVGYAVHLALDAGVKWAFGDKNKQEPVTVYAAGSAGNSDVALIKDGEYWRWSSGANTVMGGSPHGVAAAVFNIAYLNEDWQQYQLGSCRPNAEGTVYYCDVLRRWRGNASAEWGEWYVKPNDFSVIKSTSSPYSCPVGHNWHNGQCVPSVVVVTEDGPKTLKRAAELLTEQELNSPLNPALVAGSANTLWQRAAEQPGYSGFPYPYSNPITAAEAEQFMNENPGIWPKVRDFVQPRTDYQTNENTATLPRTATNTIGQPAPDEMTSNQDKAVTNSGGDGAKVNLGPDPGIGAPSLQPPTMEDIMRPIMQMLPEFRGKDFVFPVGQCPTWKINAFERVLNIDKHCELFEQMKPTVRGASLLAWSIVSVIIILGA